MIDNRAVYEESEVVNEYIEKCYLDKPEIVLLNRLGNKLEHISMLDIGVGGGRTTYFFGPRVKNYIGIDYSENMVKECRKKYPMYKFFVCDARDMSKFERHKFDLILFSFNGIDYIDHNSRLKVLKDIRCLCSDAGGIFLFSSHNFNYIPTLLSIKYSLNPAITLISIFMHIMLKLKNRGLKYSDRYAIINDGAHNFKLSTYYITPEEQVSQLIAAGFSKITALSLNSGMDLKLGNNNREDPWIYYLCEV